MLPPILHRLPFRPLWPRRRPPIGAIVQHEGAETIVEAEGATIKKYLIVQTPPWRLTSDERLQVARETNPSMRWMDIVPIHRSEVMGAIKRGEDVPPHVKEEHGL